ncbi:SLATT domain-containing protein, partial [Streptomyces sp. SID8455]|nr:SLATT domain-containing protein [Streptomyces sp. SID8455]
MVFRNADLPALFHRTDAIAVARQREAVNTTRVQLALLVAGTVPAALPWHAEETLAVQLLYGAAVLAYLGVLFTTYL